MGTLARADWCVARDVWRPSDLRFSKLIIFMDAASAVDIVTLRFVSLIFQIDLVHYSVCPV